MKIYDKNNVFAKIIRGEIPCTKVFESKYSLAFNDVNPLSKIHVIVIPKGEYVDYNDFIDHGPNDEILDIFQSIKQVSKKLEMEREGYRLLTNIGEYGGQEVPHLHFHILGGEFIGSIVNK